MIIGIAQYDSLVPRIVCQGDRMYTRGCEWWLGVMTNNRRGIAHETIPQASKPVTCAIRIGGLFLVLNHATHNS